MDNRRAMTAILYVLCTRCRWQDLPRSLGVSSTVHHRYQEWKQTGVFQGLQEAEIWGKVLSPEFSDER